MSSPNKRLEKSYYEPIRKFLESEMNCITATTNKNGTPRRFICLGLSGLIVDVYGLGGVKERNSRSIEGVAVEVKRSRRRVSLRSIVQAGQYSRLAHRCYLAQPREFSRKDKIEASRLGVGLLQIKGKQILVISESRPFSPELETFELFLHKSLLFVRCRLCACHVQKFKSRNSTRDLPTGHLVEDHVSPLVRGALRNKRMYLCNECQQIVKGIACTRRLEESVRRLEKQIKALKSAVT